MKNISNKFLVVDVNVIFSAILNQGDSWKVFAKNAEKKRFILITPQFLLVELGKHTTEIAQRTKLSLKEAEEALQFIERRIIFISEEDYKEKLKEAREILKEHEKDVPYLALALAFHCKIFSGDKTLKTIIPDKVRTPKELLEEF